VTEVSNVANTVLTTLDIGSGIDSQKLARDLTDAIQLPQEENIQKKIDYSSSSISAYGLVKYQIDKIKSSFEKLNDANELSSSTGISSDSTKITLSALSGTAQSGVYDLTVSQLAQNQRVTSDQYTSTSQSLNSGSSFDISLAIGATKGAVSAIYNATAIASETTTLVVGDGSNTVTIPSATYTSIADQVTAIRNGSGYDNLLFTVHENADGDGIEFRYKTEGSVSSAPTFTGTGTAHTITNPTLGVSVLTPVTGVSAKYAVTGTASESTNFVIGDGTTTVRVSNASYTSIAQQVAAIQASTGYENLKFTISENSSGTGFEIDYKTTSTVSTTPTFTGSASTHTISTIITGRTPVNSPATTTINVASDTPLGVVSAINAANTGVKATLLDTGTGANSFKIILTGETGSNGVFTLTSTPDLGFHDTANALQSAQDSIIEFEDLTVIRSSNTLTDVIDGATINLMATSTADISLTISNDKSTLKTNIQEVVNNYNDLLLMFENFTATDSEAEMAGALSEDNSLVRFLKDKIRAVVFADSSTASGEIVGLRSLGVEVNRSGNIIFNTNLYDTAILSNYDDVVTMFTADSNNQSVFSGTSMGLGQDVVEALDDLTDATGVVTLREATASSELADRESDLIKLEERMEKVYQRYLLQFGTMEKLMATLDSTKDYLTSQFETLAKAYDSN